MEQLKANFRKMTREESVIVSNSTYLRNYIKDEAGINYVCHSMYEAAIDPVTSPLSRLALVYLFHEVIKGFDQNIEYHQRTLWINGGVPYFLFRLAPVYRDFAFEDRIRMCKLLGIWRDDGFIIPEVTEMLCTEWNRDLDDKLGIISPKPPANEYYNALYRSNVEETLDADVKILLEDACNFMKLKSWSSFLESYPELAPTLEPLLTASDENPNFDLLFEVAKALKVFDGKTPRLLQFLMGVNAEISEELKAAICHEKTAAALSMQFDLDQQHLNLLIKSFELFENSRLMNDPSKADEKNAYVESL
eukprot:GDKJ01000758.1.p1 GENE.GDKJ01000758.1~~GDKJ01000758.1.p1  ORF type:complete len:306 (-),score=59.75 GDKJ01000758.1:80-997(-)